MTRRSQEGHLVQMRQADAAEQSAVVIGVAGKHHVDQGDAHDRSPLFRGNLTICVIFIKPNRSAAEDSSADASGPTAQRPSPCIVRSRLGPMGGWRRVATWGVGRGMAETCVAARSRTGTRERPRGHAGPAAHLRPDRAPRRRTLSVGAGLLAHGSTSRIRPSRRRNASDTIWTLDSPLTVAGAAPVSHRLPS